MNNILRTAIALLAGCLAMTLQNALAQTDTIVPDRAVVIGGVIRGGRSTFSTDPVQRQIVLGQWRTPKPGERLEDAPRAVWEEVRSAGEGRFRHSALRGGYASVTVQLRKAGVMILEASGHSMVYVNGQPRTGDPYGYGYVRLPVDLKAGENDLLFACGRGEFSVRLTPPSAAAMLIAADATLPDLVSGDNTQPFAAIPVINAAVETLRGATITIRSESGRVVRSRLPDIPPLSVRKVPFRLPPAPAGAQAETTVRLSLACTIGGRSREADSAEVKLRVRDARETRKCTFVSDIDGSVQYYAVVPPRPPLSPARAKRSEHLRPGLVLTLHGASVEAIGQAACYAPKRDMWIVAPTNRRPYGFDWEEWGRMDALEVLSRAKAELHTDLTRTYLTGHSMGGHGAWHIGVTFPGLFAAVGPSAGWVSFQSYGGGARYGEQSAIERILRRASSSGDTMALATNLKPLGVYILHGDQDDNVPVTEARAMAAKLKEFHTNFTLFEQPGAGHWWGAPSDPGTGCVDWPPMFDLFHRSVIAPADETRMVDFTTMNPGVSSAMQWVTILQQQRCMEPSSVKLRCDPVGRRFVGTTTNVAVMLLDTAPFDAGATVALDLDGWKGETRVPQAGEALCLRRTSDGWKVAERPSPAEKGPGRAGPFKEAFCRRFVLVYSTGGTAEENAWSFARARYDAEAFWYRGNGAPDVVPDTAFDGRRYAHRSVILYGNADTNTAWSSLLGACPVHIARGSLKIGARMLEGSDLACLFCYPRPDSTVASVAVVGGTGLTGMRLTDRAPYFVSGTPFPDLLAWSPDALISGTAGARAAGFFGNDWSVERGEFVVAP